MENIQGQLATPKENIHFGKMCRRSTTRIFSFLTCIAILIAAFAMSGVWLNRENMLGFLDKTPADTGEGGWQEDQSTESVGAFQPSQTESIIPEGATAVLPLDLSYKSNQLSILQNETLYRPNLEEIKNKQSITDLSSDGPLVLILHTHASEAYLPPQVSYLEGSIGQKIYSTEEDRSIVAVGGALCDVLNQNGISAIQCTDQHGKSGTLQNSYQGAAACIEHYLEKYPSIQYVIDLHRDGILTENRELVRTVTTCEGESYSQVMAVVGTDGNGTEHLGWQSNLSLAIRLYEGLERKVENLCRSISLRNASYNQELAPNSLLLEIGSAGNSQEEAIRSAKLVGEVLSELITVNQFG